MSFRVRPVTADDFQAIYEMAKLTGGGFTNLPPDRGALVEKLSRSEDAFSRDGEEPCGDLFMFVLENTKTKQIRGTCQVFSKVGTQQPFYSYRVSTLTQTSRELGRTFRAEMLTLCTDFEGASEVGGLFLHPGERAGGLGMLLARSRYLFIKLHRKRFAEKILAELRGVIDESGGSPFWDAIAGKFFGMNFQEADEFNAMHGTQFIADLMPKTPIYTAMLPESARHVMGVPHPSGRAAMRMLEREGFSYGGYVDIFDGGPTMSALTDQVRTIRESRPLVLADLLEDQSDEGPTQGQDCLFATGHLRSFAATCGRLVARADGTALIDRESAHALSLAPGDHFVAMGR